MQQQHIHKCIHALVFYLQPILDTIQQEHHHNLKSCSKITVASDLKDNNTWLIYLPDGPSSLLGFW